MAEYKGVDLLDFFVAIVKWKKLLLIILIISLCFGYLAIFYLVPAKFKSTATVIASENNQSNPLGALAKNLTSLPISSLGIGLKNSSENYDLFTTLIYSRTNLEEMVNHFNLKHDYNVDLMSKASKELSENIEAEITKENAYNITVFASTAQKSAEMTNYLVDKINHTVIELNVTKSKNNRIFLEERYNEIKTNLALAEDSLRIFQQKSGMLEAENQTKSTIETYSKLESELAVKQVETSVLKQLYGDLSPQVKASQISTNELSNRISKLKNNPGDNSLLMPLSSLPEKALQYFRYYRNMEIQNAMLEYIIPMYEQARYEEIKDIPVLQIIDRATPPDKKAYPPRFLFALIIALSVTISFVFFLFIKELLKSTKNEKIKFLKNELFRLKN